MEQININGENFDKETVIFKGKQSYKKRNITLRIIGSILVGLGILIIIYALSSDNPEYKQAAVIVTFVGMAIAGVVLWVITFLPKDYVTAGIKMIEVEKNKKNQLASTRNSVQVRRNVPKEITKPDRVISLNDKYHTQVQLKTNELLFSFVQGAKHTKVYTPEDILGCEIMVDDEEVFNSTNKSSVTNASFTGKEIGEGISGIGSIISKFGGYAKVVGKVTTAAGTAVKGANVERNTTSNNEEKRRSIIHKYTFIVRLNDLNFPSFVANDISLEEMEDLGNTFAILLQHKQNAENVVRSKTEVPQEVIDVSEEQPKEIVQEDSKLIEQNTKSFDKFEEIKKYKDLLDSGILTQEEFDAKKKELLS